jgi:transcriptional regulator with XRE-family HTH domain
MKPLTIFSETAMPDEPEAEPEGEPTTSTFWAKVESRMGEKGLIAETLAKVSGLDTSKISRLGGGQMPKLADAMKIAIALDVTLDYLAGDGEIENPPASRERVVDILMVAQKLTWELTMRVLVDALARKRESVVAFLDRADRDNG